MNKELIDIAWACLPKEFREEVKRMYRIADSDVDQMIATIMLENVFGLHNLTSDAEGEEMLTVSRKRVQELFNEYQELYGETKGKCHDKEVALSASHFYGKMCAFSDLFGSKCLPDEACNIASNVASSEPKPSEPKFKVGDKAILKGYVCTITGIVFEQGKLIGYKIESPQLHGNATVPEDYLEPYTEPTDLDKSTSTCTDERKSQERLKIAAILAAGMLANDNNSYPIDRALELADALLVEAQKGGE